MLQTTNQVCFLKRFPGWKLLRFCSTPVSPISCCCGLPKVLRTRRSWRQGMMTMAMACLHAQLPANRTCSSIPMTFSWLFMIAMNKNDITYEPMNELNHLIAFKFKSYFPLISGLGNLIQFTHSHSVAAFSLSFPMSPCRHSRPTASTAFRVSSPGEPHHVLPEPRPGDFVFGTPIPWDLGENDTKHGWFQCHVKHMGWYIYIYIYRII